MNVRRVRIRIRIRIRSRIAATAVRSARDLTRERSQKFKVMNYPDPPTLAFLGGGGESKGNPEKASGFLFAEPLKSLEKEGKTHKKARKIGKRKKQEIKLK